MTAQQLISSQGWNAKSVGSDQLAIETCPLCQNTNSKFFMNEESGLWDCKVCGESGNLYQLKSRLGITMQGVTSLKESTSEKGPPPPLPDLLAMHRRLMNDPDMADVLDYLVAERKFTIDAIEKLKLGAHYQRGEKYYMIPYFDAADHVTFFKGRNISSTCGHDKRFIAPSGREAQLYNSPVMKSGMDELVMVEGEADCISLVSQGYDTVVGIPGAGVKKAAWIEKLDQVGPKTIYLLYDTDEVGQKNAKDMATRIGLERCRNIVLPPFEVNGRTGKDVNEFFQAGYTLTDLLELKSQSKPFDVQGVQSVVDILADLTNEIENGTNKPMFDTPWPSLTAKVGGFEEGDVVGIIAEEKVGKSTMALNMLHYYACQGFTGFNFCLEMTPKRLVRKWVSHVTRTDDTPGKSHITSTTVADALSIAKQMQGDLLFGFSGSNDYKEAFDTIRQAVRRYGVKVVCFDNLQMLVKSLQHSVQETSTITNGFKALAMELKILILLIIQPHRLKDGDIVGARNAMGSSAIGKAVDCMICAHRNRVADIKAAEFSGMLDTDSTFEPYLLAKVDLSRYSSGGTCTLYFDGSTSTVREINEDANAMISQLENSDAVAV